MLRSRNFLGDKRHCKQFKKITIAEKMLGGSKEIVGILLASRFNEEESLGFYMFRGSLYACMFLINIIVRLHENFALES